MPSSYFSSALVMLLLILSGCKKDLELSPVLQIDKKTVFNSNSTAIAAMTGVYTGMVNGVGPASGAPGISMIAGLSADELKLYYNGNALLSQAYLNNLSSSNSPFWKELYQYIYKTNSVIDGVNASTSISAAIKQQLLGEAHFSRAFFYFYLVNLFGNVPLITSTDYDINRLASRSSSQDVYAFIIEDLQQAEQLLNEQFLAADLENGTSERVRPTASAAAALLSRVYLYTGQYALAESEATKVISNSLFSLPADLGEVFKKNSSEAIWQLQPVQPGFNTYDGNTFILAAAPDSRHPSAISDELRLAFEPGDLRRAGWVDSSTNGSDIFYYPYKYKIGPQNLEAPTEEYLMVLRLGEQYLIRAEARAQQDNLSGGREDVNAIRARAGLAGIVTDDKNLLLDSIAQEKRIELFTEWGHRWFDLKRTEKLDGVMEPVALIKGTTWSSTKSLFPIPLNEIQLAPNIEQNEGY